MNHSRSLVLSVLFLSLALACGGGGEAPDDAEHATEPAAAPAPARATATIEARSDSEVSGSATSSAADGKVSLTVEVRGAPAGEHAIHIHAVGDCSAPDGTSAGGHWNPTEEDHGQWGTAPHHLGDVGNIQVGDDGSGSISLTTERWSIGTGETNDVVGKGIILHAGVDDFTSQPTGAAGERIGCGVIE